MILLTVLRGHKLHDGKGLDFSVNSLIAEKFDANLPGIVFKKA